MKKRFLAVLFAAMMLAGCGGAADEQEGHDHATDQQAEEMVDDAEEIDAETEALVETMKEELSVYADYLPQTKASSSASMACLAMRTRWSTPSLCSASTMPTPYVFTVSTVSPTRWRTIISFP